MTQEQWLEAHAYLRPVSDLAAEIDRAAMDLEVFDARLPDWEHYRPDFLAGVPLLSSAEAAIDLEPGERMAAALLARLAVVRHADAASPGFARYAGWIAMRRFLRPVVEAFTAWRDEDRWMRRHCPTCGSLPAMAQLVGADPGRKRLLSCGCCGTRWQFKRTGCPFCHSDSQRLASIAVEGEPVLRIDHCESCRGYLKTYDGEGDERLLLADWSSLHLDLIAHDRGLERLADSLYDPAFSTDVTVRPQPVTAVATVSHD
jgi:FdhE protein